MNQVMSRKNSQRPCESGRTTHYSSSVPGARQTRDTPSPWSLDALLTGKSKMTEHLVDRIVCAPHRSTPRETDRFPPMMIRRSGQPAIC